MGVRASLHCGRGDAPRQGRQYAAPPRGAANARLADKPRLLRPTSRDADADRAAGAIDPGPQGSPRACRAAAEDGGERAGRAHVPGRRVGARRPARARAPPQAGAGTKISSSSPAAAGRSRRETSPARSRTAPRPRSSPGQTRKTCAGASARVAGRRGVDPIEAAQKLRPLACGVGAPLRRVIRGRRSGRRRARGCSRTGSAPAATPSPSLPGESAQADRGRAARARVQLVANRRRNGLAAYRRRSGREPRAP